jgi:hypothetical protein
MQTPRERENIVPTHESRHDGMSGQRHPSAVLYPRNGSAVPIRQEVGWCSELV